MNIYKFNATINDQQKDKKLGLDFQDELKFNVKHTGNKSTRDKTSIKLLKSHEVRSKGKFFQIRYFYHLILMNY